MGGTPLYASDHDDQYYLSLFSSIFMAYFEILSQGRLVQNAPSITKVILIVVIDLSVERTLIKIKFEDMS